MIEIKTGGIFPPSFLLEDSFSKKEITMSQSHSINREVQENKIPKEQIEFVEKLKTLCGEYDVSIYPGFRNDNSNMGCIGFFFGKNGNIMEYLSDKPIKAGMPNQFYFPDLESGKVLECQIQ